MTNAFTITSYLNPNSTLGTKQPFRVDGYNFFGDVTTRKLRK